VKRKPSLRSPIVADLRKRYDRKKEKDVMMYVKKPIPVAATQRFKNGDHPDDYESNEARAKGWEGAVVRYFRHPSVGGGTPCRTCGVRMHDHGWIDTLEGGHTVCPGDWIIKGVQGEYYPCKPDIFAATYDPVEQT